MKCRHRSSLFTCCAFLLLMLSAGALQEVQAAGKSYKPKAENSFYVRIGERQAMCARKKPGRKFEPVQELRRGRVKPLKVVLRTLKNAVKNLERVSRNSKKAKAKRAELIALRELFVVAKAQCAEGINGNGVFDPTAPLASTSSATGNGVEAVALSLVANPNSPGATVTCRFTAVPSTVTVEAINGCNALVRPASHRVGSATLKFVAVRSTDGATSKPANAEVTWSQNGSFIGDHLSMARYKDRLTDEEAAYFIRWVGVGADAGTLRQRAQEAGGLDFLVNRFLTPQSGASCAGVEQAALAASRRHMGQLSFRQNNIDFYTSERERWTVGAASTYLLYLLRHSCDPLKERMALLWHNHFATSFAEFEYSNERAHYIKRHLDLLRGEYQGAPNGLFARLDHLVAAMHGSDGVMLNWLDNDRNQFNQAGGNENYARELQELFTLGLQDPVTGAENYNEPHVYALRAALMGYTDDAPSSYQLSGQRAACCTSCGSLPSSQHCQTFDLYQNYPVFVDSRWNFSNQPIGTYLFQGKPWGRYDVFKANTLGASGLSRTPNFNDSSQDNLTPYLMYNHPGVARYLAATLITRFTSLELTEEMVVPVAEALIQNSYDPTEALRMVLSSSAFFAAENQDDSIANPAVRVISFLRMLDLPMDYYASSNRDLVRAISDLSHGAGMPIGRMPTVFGVPEPGRIIGGVIRDGSYFASTMAQVEAHRHFVRYVNELHSVIEGSSGNVTWSSLILPNLGGARPSARQTLDHLLEKLGISVTPQQDTMLYEYLTTLSTRTVTEPSSLVVPDPNYTFSIDWNNPSLDNDRFAALVALKAPGILQLLFSLPQLAFR